MSTLDEAIDEDLPQPEEHTQAPDWGWLSSGVHSLRPLFLAGLLVVALLALLLPPWLHSGRAGAAPAYPREVAQVTFAVAGDVMPHEAVRNAAKAAGEGSAGWTALFAGVADIFSKADFGFVNFETPSAPSHSRGTKPFLFDAPVSMIEGLKASGIKIVSFANNHVMDQGWAGFAETRQHLAEQGLIVAGTGASKADAWRPVFTAANGIQVGWLGMTRWLNGNRNSDKDAEPHVNFFPYAGDNTATGVDEAAVLAAIAAARQQCDLLVVSIHWGIEYAPAPRPDDVELAHKMLEAGASVIVGHHPHVLQPVENYRTQDGRDTVIFYSFGNFLSNQSRSYVDGLMPDKDGEPRDSLIAQFSAVKKDYGPAGVRVELAHVGLLPVWGDNNRNEIATGKAKLAVIHPILIDREIPKLQARIDELTQASASTPLDANQKKEFIELTNRLKLLTDRRQAILARTGDDFLIDTPKPAVN